MTGTAGTTAPWVFIRDLKLHAGQPVTLKGWVCGRRQGGRVEFVEVRDGTGICQCVVEPTAVEAFAAAGALSLESSLEVEGSPRAEARAPGGFELAVARLRPIGGSADYPITRKSHGVDFLLDQRHLWLRSRRPAAILRIRASLIRACRAFFDDRGFTLVDTPILVQGAGEDAQSLFGVEYFERRAFLTQTGQLHLEAACMSLGRVYCFGPTFRAEKSKTRRHLTEFWMIEPEIAFADLEDVMRLTEEMVCHAVAAVLRECDEELRFLGRNPEPLRRVQPPFPRLRYDDAVRLLRSPETRRRLEEEQARDEQALRERRAEADRLQAAPPAAGWKRDRAVARLAELAEEIEELETDVRNRPGHLRLAQEFQWGGDLGGSDETILSRAFDRPLFVTHYPREAKAFYMKRDPDDPRVVRNMDLLAPEGYGEIVGGSQREDDPAALEAAARGAGVEPALFRWYFDLRRYGTVPHGGFGMGIERALTWICGLKHVRETIPFPRTMSRLEP